MNGDNDDEQQALQERLIEAFGSREKYLSFMTSVFNEIRMWRLLACVGWGLWITLFVIVVLKGVI